MSNYRRAYEENSYVFITLANRILDKNIEILRNSYRKVKDNFDFKIFEIVVLPDHVHLIIKAKK